MSAEANVASVNETLEKCKLKDTTWQQLTAETKLLLRQAVKMLDGPNLKGLYYVNGWFEDDDGNNVMEVQLVKADSHQDALDKFARWADDNGVEINDGPRAWRIDPDTANSQGILDWYLMDSMSADGYRSGPFAR